MSFAMRHFKLVLQMPANGLLITRSNIHELTSDDILSFHSKEYWHKFILENGGIFEKEAVLLAVLQSITPFDLVPVKFTVTGKDAHFLARNCGQAIEKFCLNLLHPIELTDPPGEIAMTIQTCSVSIDQYKMNMQSHLKEAIERRYNENQKGFISLSAFHKDPELYEVLFCPLSKPKFLAYVLSILKRILTITAIDLSNNDIEILKPLEILQEFDGLVSVNLSNNKIKDFNLSELLQKAVPALEELNLNGNPVCSTFKTGLEYLNWIREKNPSVKKVDGISISNGLPSQQVYLCSDKIAGIINEFLGHYFTLYDSNRKALLHTYGKNAMFSITCDNQPFSDFKDSAMEFYIKESKNLLKENDVKKIGIVNRKNTNIINVLSKLPSTEHDPYSFKVDVLFYNEPYIVLTVTGIFKDLEEPTRIRSFSRTFTLKRIGTDEFKITNDLFHVTNASLLDVNNSFLHKKPTTTKQQSFLGKEEEQRIIKVVSKLTEMNPAYSEKCLKDCGWNLKRALEMFLENYETFNIPPEAFKKGFPS